MAKDNSLQTLVDSIHLQEAVISYLNQRSAAGIAEFSNNDSEHTSLNSSDMSDNVFYI